MKPTLITLILCGGVIFLIQGQSQKIRYRFEPNQSYVLSIENKYSVTKLFKTWNSTFALYNKASMRMEITKVEQDRVWITCKYLSYRFDISDGGNQIIYIDTEDPDFPYREAFRKIMTITFSMSLDAQGALDVSGLEYLNYRLGLELAADTAWKKSSSSYNVPFVEKNIMAIFRAVFPIYPDKSLATGVSWETEHENQNGKGKTTYRVTAMEDELMSIERTELIVPDSMPFKSDFPDVVPVKYKMNVHRRTGWPISVHCDDSFTWEGIASQNGEQVQIKMKFDQLADLQFIQN